MQKIIQRILVILFVLLVSACAATSKVAPTEPTVANSPKTCPPHLQKLCNVYSTIRGNYIKQIPDDELTDMFIRGFMKELREEMKDPYSKYSTAKEEISETIQDDKYAGLGMNIKKDANAPYAIKVQGVFPGTPAFKAGIVRGDQITEIDGIPVANKNIEESRNLIRGKIGTPVTLTISRPCEGQPFPVSIKRKGIEDTISGIVKMIAPHYAYVYIPTFEEDKHIAIRVKYSLAKFSQKYGKPYGLIIDLRNNPGGKILEGKYLVSLFVEKGNILYEKARDGSEHSWDIPKNSQDILSGAPIIILVNENSASTSEIVAGAMQDFKRAIIMGTNTFRKGVLQTNYVQKDGSKLHITTAYTLTPNRIPIDKAGITSDIYVEEAPDESCTGDHQLAVALDVLKGRNKQRTIMAQK